MRYPAYAMRRRRRRGRSCAAGIAVLAAAITLALPRPAGAQVPRWSDPELARFSRAIVTGRVASVSTGPDPALPGAIYTYVALDVGEVVKGWVPERQIVIKQLGGRLGDLELVVGDQAQFRVGEETLLFLEVRPRDGTLYTTALWQGKWDISRDPVTGDGVATRRLPAPARGRGPRTQGRPGAEPAPADEEYRLLRPFLAELRAWVGPEARRPGRDPMTLRPVEAPLLEAGSDPGAPTGSSFTLLGPARWHEADGGGPIAVQVDAAGQSGLAGGGFSQIDTARGIWNDSGSTLALLDGGTRAARCFNTFEGDARMSIAFMDPCDEIDDSGGTLAIGGFFSSYNAADERTVNGTTFRRILQGMIVANDGSAALGYLQAPHCFQDIVVHEMGHAFGLGHTGSSGNIMQPFIDAACQSGQNASLGPDDIAGIHFIYPSSEPVVPPEAPAVEAPAGTMSSGQPTYRWTHDGDADSYQVQIIRSGEQSLYSAQHEAGGLCSGSSCSLTSPPAPTLASGDYVWRVRGRNAAGSGPWGPYVAFTVTDDAPGSPVPAAPSGTIGDTTPTYSFGEVTGAERYQLHIVRSGVGSVYSALHDAADICSGSTCSIAPAPQLQAGASYVWRVRALNDSGAGAWSEFVAFSVAGGAPPAPALIDPQGLIADPTPTYGFNEVAGATRYQLHVIEVGVRSIHSALYDAAAVCGGGVCSIDGSAVGSLQSGSSYVWRVRGRNGFGNGEWSAFRSFDVQ